MNNCAGMDGFTVEEEEEVDDQLLTNVDTGTHSNGTSQGTTPLIGASPAIPMIWRKDMPLAH